MDDDQVDDRQLSPMGTYSYAADLARKVLQAKGSPQQYKAALTKQGVKPDEFKHSNYDQAFAGKPMVTRDQLAQHFQQSLPKVQETTLGRDESKADYGYDYDPAEDAPDRTKFSQYTLPGGTNYRETLLHLPAQPANARIPSSGYGRPDQNVNTNDYRSSHWDTPNVLAHLRMSDRALPGGQKALHLEELQSDWAQEGRKKGFGPREGKIEQQPGGTWRITWPDGTFSGGYDTETSAETAKEYRGKGVPSAPYVDSTQKWVDLGLKRLLHEAAKGGYHKVVMTPGEEQAKRYDLSKQVKELKYFPKEQELHVLPHDTHKHEILSMPPEKLEQHVGKDVAKKLLEQPLGHTKYAGHDISYYTSGHHLEGEGLRVGGEGMKAFYDQMLPKALEKLAKKHDPEAQMRLHGHTLPGKSAHSFLKTKETVKAHSLDITPKMRASILKGQTAYATGGSVPEPQPTFPPSDVPGLDTARQALASKPRDQDPAASHAELSRLLDKTRATQIGKMVDRYQRPTAGTAVKRLHGDLKGLAQEGEPGRMWYEKSSKRILDYVQGDKDEAHKIAQLIAIYSPQTGVPTNTANAIKAYNRAKTGQKMWAGDIIDRDKSFDTISAANKYAQSLGDNITKVPLDDSGKRFLFARHNMKGYENIATADRDLKAHLLMNHDIPFEGRKTNNFYRNLMVHIDPTIDQGSTQDLWMARAFGFHDDAVSNANKYDFMEKLTHKLGKELGWKPHQVQAAIWTAMKTRQEAVKNDVMKAAVGHGIGKMVNDPETGKPNFEIEPGKEHLYNSLMRKHALGAVLDPGHIQRSARDFSDFLDANLAHVSWEATPSKDIQHLQGLEQKPPEVKADYHKRISQALQDEHGNDLLAKYLGMLSPGTVESPGYWQGNVNPASHLQVATTRIKKALKRPDIDAASKELMDHYANARGLLLKQDAVGYHRPFYNPQVTKANGVEYKFDKDLTGDQIRQLGHHIDAIPNTAMVPSGPGLVRVIHFGEKNPKDPDGKRIPLANHLKHHKAVDEALHKSGLSDTLTAEKRLFASDGELRGNDWKANPNGEDYRKRLGAAGRSDVLRYVSDVLAPKVQAVDEEFAREHGLPRDQKLEASLRRPPTEEVEKPVAKATGGVVDRTPAEEHMLKQSGDLTSKSVPADDALIEKALALAQSDRKGHKDGGAVTEEASVVAEIKSDLKKLTTVLTAQNAQIDKLTRLLLAPQIVERDENNRIKKIYRDAH